jgi:hypothetical protein
VGVATADVGLAGRVTGSGHEDRAIPLPTKSLSRESGRKPSDRRLRDRASAPRESRAALLREGRKIEERARVHGQPLAQAGARRPALDSVFVPASVVATRPHRVDLRSTTGNEHILNSPRKPQVLIQTLPYSEVNLETRGIAKLGSNSHTLWAIDARPQIASTRPPPRTP